MKQKFFLAVVLLFISFKTFSQAPEYAWARSDGGNYFDYANNSATDANGNVYVVGEFWGDSIMIGNTTLYSQPGNFYNIYLAKYDANGNFLWAKGYIGSSQETGLSCAVDAVGNVIICGKISSTTSFDTILVSTSGYFDAFIAKINPSGNVLWAQSAGGTITDAGYGVSADAENNIYLCGGFGSDSAVFDNITLYNTHSPSQNIYNMFIAKYDSAGNVIWAHNAGSDEHICAYDCSTDPTGGVFVMGLFDCDTLIFGNDTLYNSTTSKKYFITKYDDAGNVVWARDCGNTPWIEGFSCSADPYGNVYLAGHTQFGVDFGNHSFPDGGMFIVKYDANGNDVWAKQGTGGISFRGYGCSSDSRGDVYVSGDLYGPSSFVIDGDSIFTDANYAQYFVFKFDSSGNLKWKKYGGGATTDYSLSCSADPFGNVFVTGIYDSNPFMVVGADTLVNIVSFDAFLFKINCTAPTPPDNITLPANQSICYGTSTTLSATGSGNLTWYDASSGGNFLGAGNNFTTPTLTSTTTFYVQDSIFCESERTAVVVTVYPPIDTTLTLTTGGQGMMSNENGGTYQWINCDDGTPITGATNQSYTATENGSYAVVVNKNGCMDTSVCVDVTNVGVNEILNDIQVYVFPNPADENFVIVSSEKIHQLNMMDVTGKIIYSKTANTNTITINCENISSGIYVLKITDLNNSELKTVRIVIDK